jgi:peptidoglycan L-alanyl-D-glutamate endopeptidase CwlK
MNDATFFGGLLPELAAKAKLHRAACAARGLSIVFTSGWRSPEEQTKLYAQGRTLPGHIVTNALPEKAPHCRGAAYDLVPIFDEQAAWDRLDLFQAAADFARGLGLVWGGTWPKLKDLPHFELPGWRELPLKES